MGVGGWVGVGVLDEIKAITAPSWAWAWAWAELGKREKTNENSRHYVIASSRPPERRSLERLTLVPIQIIFNSLLTTLLAPTNMKIMDRVKSQRGRFIW